ncbi:hypothetical protein ElyMa_000930100 [Elysia marginata]|uniref:Reverse transcriptase domain-containing protein n=1 Tax=Elysia marginata TaxID=1093978 RepID=A0AAV4H9T6_9GAST|nr:hypothetical protein ElyMa_000930100 [Elysia marginata]
MREADKDDLGLKIGGRNMTNLRYADGTALLTDNITSMRRILYRVDEAGTKVGLRLNAKKTKVLQVFSKHNRVERLKFNKSDLENVDDFKHLGSKDIKIRTGMATKKVLELNNI